ncbi:hypothetical protein ACFFX0_27170 [Citricoccus parietis]|uniref:Uncharacterized protein n=1 Tax=Citricoccus parietis TaxID=592307 RepID=A0ABV5G6W8_9MICC
MPPGNLVVLPRVPPDRFPGGELPGTGLRPRCACHHRLCRLDTGITQCRVPDLSDGVPGQVLLAPGPKGSPPALHRELTVAGAGLHRPPLGYPVRHELLQLAAGLDPGSCRLHDGFRAADEVLRRGRTDHQRLPAGVAPGERDLERFLGRHRAADRCSRGRARLLRRLRHPLRLQRRLRPAADGDRRGAGHPDGFRPAALGLHRRPQRVLVRECLLHRSRGCRVRCGRGHPGDDLGDRRGRPGQ